MKQIKSIIVDFVTHKELKLIQKELKYKRIGSVINYLLNNYRHKK